MNYSKILIKTAVFSICLLLVFTVSKAQTDDDKTSEKNFSESTAYQPTKLPEEYSKVKKPKKSKNDEVNAATNLTGGDAVLIPVSVFNKNGNFIVGLKEADFKVFVDEREVDFELVENENKPLDIYLMIDTSPSTKERIKLIREMISTFVAGLKPEDRVEIILFNDKFKVLNQLTNDRNVIEKSIKKIDVSGGTSLYEAVSEFFQNRIADHTARNALIIFSDGVDTTSETASFTTSLAAAERFNMPVFPVYFDTLEDFSKQRLIDLGSFGAGSFPPGVPTNTKTGDTKFEYEIGKFYLNDLTKLSGGRAIAADTVAAKNQTGILNSIANELRLKYYLKIKPAETTGKDQSRQIKIRVNRPGLFVMARGSYIPN